MTAIQAMADEAERDGARAVAAVGTAGLRMARNGDDVLASIRERTGIDVEVISSEVEARLAYLAARAGLDLAEGMLAALRKTRYQPARQFRIAAGDLTITRD